MTAATKTYTPRAYLTLEIDIVMDIRNLPPNVNPSDLYKSGQANEASGASSGKVEQPGEAAPQPADDRVDISDAGRAAQAEESARAEELTFARKAMLGIPPLDASRAEDIFQRINSGYYSQPDIVKQMAEGVMENFEAAGGLSFGGEADASGDASSPSES